MFIVHLLILIFVVGSRLILPLISTQPSIISGTFFFMQCDDLTPNGGNGWHMFLSAEEGMMEGGIGSWLIHRIGRLVVSVYSIGSIIKADRPFFLLLPLHFSKENHLLAACTYMNSLGVL
ncbi:hypothetical protein F4814DRAFT_166197 [Daldinia grandis]|nr:hypothetical protein F4814DRAFT_166197 [Daldinia grandis]